MKRNVIASLMLITLFGLMPLSGLAGESQELQQAPQPVMPAPPNEPDDGVMKQKPLVEDLGNDRYRIGKILVDKKNARFTLSGSVLPYEEGKPLEFIAVTKQGHKGYESLVEMDTNAFEFNLACILIGLDAKHSTPAEYHFDPMPIQGDRVAIRIVWDADGKSHAVDPVEWLKTGEKISAPADWIYTGSQFIDGNRYLAQIDGTLIGLVHDPASIIEHRTGVGLGNWGMLTVDPSRAPVGGTRIDLTVSRVKP